MKTKPRSTTRFLLDQIRGLKRAVKLMQAGLDAQQAEIERLRQELDQYIPNIADHYSQFGDHRKLR